MNDLLVSMIRTWVPIVLGSVLTWLIEAGVDIDRDGVIVAVTGFVIAVYYAVVRVLETRYPAVGVLLGRKTAPTYQP